MSLATTTNLIAVDIGNTSSSFHCYGEWATASRPLPIASHRVPTRELSENNCSAKLVELLLDGNPAEQLIWRVASVQRRAEGQLADSLREARPADDYQLLRNADVPLTVNVREPDRVGTDRLVASLAANRIRIADRPAIIVDAGSAITIDLLSEDGVFEGGAILPGFQMSATALANQTDALPIMNVAALRETPDVVGKWTEAAMQSGVVLGTLGAVHEIVRRMSETALRAQVFVTGGNRAELAWLRNDQWQHVDDLVALGIALVTRHLAQTNA